MEVLISPLLALYLLFNMVGSTWPDVDWKLKWLGLRHRSPITHSFIVPGILHLLIIYVLPKYQTLVVGETLSSIILVSYQAFLIGVAAHLLGDNVKTGNLVNVPKRWEFWWYFVQGGVVIVMLYFTGFFSVGWL